MHSVVANSSGLDGLLPFSGRCSEESALLARVVKHFTASTVQDEVGVVTVVVGHVVYEVHTMRQHERRRNAEHDVRIGKDASVIVH